MASENPAAPAQNASSDASQSQSAYDDLRRLIPSLAAELDLLRTSLREHNLWLLRYGHGTNTSAAPPTSLEPAQQQDRNNSPDQDAASIRSADHLPEYSASDVPPYKGTREEVAERRDQLMEWLREGEDVLRDYSARFTQLAGELHLPAEDLLGTWREAAPDNALPDYARIEPHEELMVGGALMATVCRTTGGSF